MQPDFETSQELRELFRERVRLSFSRAKICVRCAKAARARGDAVEVKKWTRAAQILRAAAANWRQRALGP